MANKLSPSLKALVNAPYARGGAIPAPPRAAFESLFDSLSASAKSRGLGWDTWLTLSTAAIVTLNSPATLCALHTYSVKDITEKQALLKASIGRAAIMREAGLKCISFSGIPRTINNLGALRSHLSPDVQNGLKTSPHRQVNQSNVKIITYEQALALWNSVYDPFSSKLLQKLADSHPDLPVHILQSHYGPLLSDPSTSSTDSVTSSLAENGGIDGDVGKVGRVLTSVVAIACLRAQGGVGPQVTSHVFGLKKASEMARAAQETELEGESWLTGDDGCEWVLKQVDKIVDLVAGGRGSTFATGANRGGKESKL